MTRPLHLAYPGALSHVTTRGKCPPSRLYRRPGVAAGSGGLGGGGDPLALALSHLLSDDQPLAPTP